MFLIFCAHEHYNQFGVEAQSRSAVSEIRTGKLVKLLVYSARKNYCQRTKAGIYSVPSLAPPLRR